MLKPLSVTAEQVRQKAAPASPAIAQRVFRAMHGYYGAAFLSKWANGCVEDGEDKGVLDAMRVWAWELKGYDEKVVLDAIARCKDAHREWPPSLPQFLALCEAVKPREAQRFAIPMSADLVKQRNAPHIAKLAALRDRIAGKREAEASLGLAPLFEAIGDAVANAGGDAAAAMLRLEREMAVQR